MSASDHLSRQQFGLEETPDPTNKGYQRLTAWPADDEDGNLGYISHRPSADGRSTEVRVINVDEAIQHRGVGSYLMDELAKRYPQIHHGGRTPEGAAFWEHYKQNGGLAK